MDGNASPYFSARSCTHTAGNDVEEDQWWQVSLERLVLVTSVALTNRISAGESHTTFHLRKRPLEKVLTCTVSWVLLDNIGTNEVTPYN